MSKYEKLDLVISGFGAFATFAAVVFSLWLTRRNEKRNEEKFKIKFVLLKSTKTGKDLLGIEVKNYLPENLTLERVKIDESNKTRYLKKGLFTEEIKDTEIPNLGADVHFKKDEENIVRGYEKKLIPLPKSYYHFLGYEPVQKATDVQFIGK
jgi:hypothetical protein